MTLTLVSALFDNNASAEKARQELRQAGVTDAAISAETRSDERHQDAPGPGNHKPSDIGDSAAGLFLTIDTEQTSIGADVVMDILYRCGGHSTSAPSTP